MKKGIDVSYANGRIDWDKAGKEIGFAILRSSFGSDLPEQVDSQYIQNAEGCIRNRIPFGTYHFAYFTNPESAREEANFAIRLAGQFKEKVCFIALDIEEDSIRYATQCGAHPDWTECALAFLERVRKAGYRAVIYTNQSFITSVYDWEKLKDYPLWYAAPGAAAPKYSCAVWQYSWDGSVSGISGSVDRDECFDEKLFSDHKNSSDPSASQNEPDKPEISQIHSSQVVRYTVRVTAEDGVNLRSGAGTSYRILSAVPYGTKLNIIRQTSGGGYHWGLTRYENVLGWIALNYTRKIQNKSLDEIAREVIAGKWSAGAERERLLHQAGYDYQAVQNRVNELMQ